MGAGPFVELPADDARFSEGLILKQGKEDIAVFGLVHPKFLDVFEIRQPVLYADLSWEILLKNVTQKRFEYRDIPKFPEVKRDFALLLDTEVSYQEVRDLAFKTERKLLQDVQLFDVYTGKSLPPGKKSYAVSFTLLNKDKTLTDKQIDAAMKRLQTHYESELGAELR